MAKWFSAKETMLAQRCQFVIVAGDCGYYLNMELDG
jgi:hypothetical protein